MLCHTLYRGKGWGGRGRWGGRREGAGGAGDGGSEKRGSDEPMLNYKVIKHTLLLLDLWPSPGRG